jgi:hypothetical protein
MSPSESTPPRLATTGYVPPTGFLTLSTACSSPERPALFHAGNAHGVLPFREFPSMPGPAAHRDENALLAFLLLVMTRQLLLANIIEEARACAFR